MGVGGQGLGRMNRSHDLREQLERMMKLRKVSQGDVAAARGVRRQTVQAVLKGKKPIIGETLEAALEVLQARLVVSRLENDPERVRDRAFAFGVKLFRKESAVRHETLGTTVAWLCTGETGLLNNTLRSLAVQALFSPILSYEQALAAALPLVYGPLSEVHRGAVALGPEGDDFWDSRQVIVWKTELGS